MNEFLFAVWMIAGLFGVLAGYRLFGKAGLFGIIAGNVVIMNVLVTKGIVLFGLGATAGNVLYGMIFLATDILTERHGEREARRSVYVGFAAGLIAFLASMAALLMVPAEWDFAHVHLVAILTPMVRILAGSWAAYLVSQVLDTRLYAWYKSKRLPVWVRNNGSTMASQFVDTLIFCSIAFLGVMPIGAWFGVVLSSYLLKVLVAAVDTPFLYLAMNVKEKAEA